MPSARRCLHQRCRSSRNCISFSTVSGYVRERPARTGCDSHKERFGSPTLTTRRTATSCGTSSSIAATGTTFTIRRSSTSEPTRGTSGRTRSCTARSRSSPTSPSARILSSSPRQLNPSDAGQDSGKRGVRLSRHAAVRSRCGSTRARGRTPSPPNPRRGGLEHAGGCRHGDDRGCRFRGRANRRDPARDQDRRGGCGVRDRAPDSGRSWQGVDEVFLEFHDFAPCSRSAIVDHLGRAGLVLVDEAFGVLHLARTSKSRVRTLNVR